MPKKRISLEILLAVAAALVLGVLLLPGGSMTSVSRLPGWLVDGAKLRLSLKQDASAGSFYERTARGPLAFASIVAELHAAWPGEDAKLVHSAALEIATDLLHHGDIEIGEITAGVFRPLAIPAWAAIEKLRQDIAQGHDFFQDSDHYVFRRK